ncbi:MAG: phosphoribosylanthranilate isomerase [Eubacterium sp.]|nr:phosphoribosylanthranilate isomerase [Eubacterium sp.]
MKKVKICGITSREEIGWLNQIKPDYAGFVVFFPKSKRNLSLDQARDLIGRLDSRIQSVAVVVKPTLDQALQIQEAGFSLIQIHGDVSEEIMNSIKIPIWKAFNVSDLAEFPKYNMMGKISGFVFDAARPGSGTTFDWDLLKQIPETDKIKMLAGGLNPDNAGQAAQVAGIDGLDTSSGVERESGIGKDRDKIENFVRQAREN